MQFRDSVEPIEVLWRDRILGEFPRYGTFWSEFVGQRRQQTGTLCPYGIRLARWPSGRRSRR